VVVGNLGYIADRLDVDPTTGAVRDVVGLQVSSTQQSDPSELAAQQQRVVASWKVALDLNGTFNGTAYLGGWHGLSAFHGFGLSRTTGVCGLDCGDFEEHVHPFLPADAAGRDIRALTITPLGDLWVGDADAVWFVAQRSQGPYNDFFSPAPQIPGQSATYLDIFPGVADMVYGIATDGAGGVYVASYNNGLAYLAPGSYAPTYWSTADKLPSNNLTSVVVDGGDVWIGTLRSGVVRYTPASGTWTYYTQAGSGLPSDDVRAIWTSTRAGVRTVYIATDYGIGVYTGP
jgi:ligand-binding sensor domain-containing protein